MPSKRSTTEFLNVDLDICVRSGLDELLTAMGRRILVLHNTGRQASVELAGNSASLEQTMLKLVKLVTSLPEEARGIWDHCSYRRMNIGIQAGSGPYAAEFALSRKAISALASIRAEMAMTVYAPR